MHYKSEKGSTLVLVTIIFAVILILGTVTLATVSYSQKYALHQVDRQQGYYVAKSGVDITANYILDASNKEGQMSKINELLGVTSSFKMTDNKGYIWDCRIQVTSASPKVEIVSKATNRTTHTKRTLKGIITDDGDGASSQIRSFSRININATSDIDFVDAVTEGNQVDITTTGKINVENVYSFGPINLITTGLNSDIIVGNVKASTGTPKVVIKATGDVIINNVESGKCEITSGGDVTIKGMVKATELSISMPTGATLSLDNSHVYTLGNKYTLNGKNVSQNVNQYLTAPPVPGSIINPIDETSFLFTEIYALPNSITNPIYFNKCSNHSVDCLQVTQKDEKGIVKELGHIKAVGASGLTHPIYYRLKVTNPNTPVVFQNLNGMQAGGKKEKYNIFIGDAMYIPVSVTFNNCTNIRFFGNIRTQIGGFNINGNVEGLQFGTPPYTFCGYEE